jgi:hypothetical protein
MARGIMKALLERRSQIDDQVNELMVRRAEIDLMLARLNEGESPPPSETPARRRNVKKTVMDIVNVAGGAGVTTSEVIERAKVFGRDLDRASVASLLSKFKGAGALTFDGERYYPASKTPPHNPGGHSFTVVEGAR